MNNTAIILSPILRNFINQVPFFEECVNKQELIKLGNTDESTLILQINIVTFYLFHNSFKVMITRNSSDALKVKEE